MNPEPPTFRPAYFNFFDHVERQRKWSQDTFGPQRVKGVIDHIKKEIQEVESAPDDLEEWIDLIILSIDGACRMGATTTQIIQGLLAKQLKNENREWPDWRTMPPDKAIEHVKSLEETADKQDALEGIKWAVNPEHDKAQGHFPGLDAHAAQPIGCGDSDCTDCYR